MKPIPYYDGWNAAIDHISKELWDAHGGPNGVAYEILKYKVSWPRIEADERLATISSRARWPQAQAQPRPTRIALRSNPDSSQ
jgi:hypothetical protein